MYKAIFVFAVNRFQQNIMVVKLRIRVSIKLLFWLYLMSNFTGDFEYTIEHSEFRNTIKPVFSDHHRGPKIVAVVGRWSLFRGYLCNKNSKWNHKMVVVVGRWSLCGSGR